MTDVAEGTGSLPASRSRRRALFVNENIGGHRTMHQHIRAALASRRVDATFIDVPPAGMLRRLAGAPMPWLARHDLDLQPLRYQLAQSAWVRNRIARRASHYDVLHLYTQNIALLSKKLLRSHPSVISLDTTGAGNAHNLPYRYPTRHTAARVRITRRFEEPALRAATLLVAQSEWVAAELRDDYGIPADRVRVIRFGITVPDQLPRTRPPGLPEVTFTGSSLARKGGHLLLDAYDRYLRGRVVLNLITTERVEVREGVTVFNDIVTGDPRLWEILSRTAVFAFPSTVDTFGYAVLEAMAAGIPVVACRSAAVPELVVDGETGLLAQPDPESIAAAVLRLVEDDDLHLRMGDAGRRRLEQNFDASVTTDALLAVMDEAIDLFAERHR